MPFSFVLIYRRTFKGGLFMKKLFIILCIATAFFMCGSSTVSALEVDVNDNSDALFLDFIQSELTPEEFESLEYTKQFVYDLDLQQAGYVIDFSFGNNVGYALLAKIRFNDTYTYELEEIRLGASPFANCVGTKIYPAPFAYLQYANGNFKDLSTNTVLNESQLAILEQKGFNYCGGTTYTGVTYTYNYDHKTEDTYNILGDVPEYSSIVGASNCAVVAGCNLIGYYDRLYENLIPNYQTYNSFAGRIFYKALNTETEAVMNTLYTLMEADVDGPGVTFTGYVNGLEEYVEGKGYTFSYNSLMSWGSFDYSAYVTAVESGKAVSLFLTNYALVPMTAYVENTNQDSVYNCQYPSNHVVIGCGYRVVSYYDSNNTLTNQVKYLRVSSGMAELDLCYLNISNFTQISNAITINVS